MKGRPRKPVELKVLDGSFQHYRDAKDLGTSPVVATGTPKPPPGTTKESLVWWDRVVPPLVALGIAKEIDSMALMKMCDSLARADSALVLMEKEKFGSPAHTRLGRLLKTSNLEFERLAAKFGMNPLDRARLRIEGPTTRNGVRRRDRS